MTSTHLSVGIDESGTSSTSIMKPPGGDCHDIFGADFHGTPSHHRVLKPPGGGTSSLFASTPEETKPRMTSSAVDGATIQNSTTNGSDGAVGKTDGNPVTGEGYDTPDTQAPAPPRARIPPGGYSSGLW